MNARTTNGYDATSIADLKARAKQFGLNVIILVQSLPNTSIANVLGKQLLRAATSVGANYRAACRSRSRADFISKITVVEEEADEAGYWLELLQQAKLIRPQEAEGLLQEARELTAIFTASGRTAKGRK